MIENKKEFCQVFAIGFAILAFVSLLFFEADGFPVLGGVALASYYLSTKY